MKQTLLLISLCTLLACKGQEHKKHNPTHAADSGAVKHNGQGEKHSHAPGSANEYMHQSSVEDLVKRFESPERDAYQKPEQVLAYLGDVAGKRIMDIGAGSGYFSVKLAKKGAQVIAADVDDEFQAFLKKRIEEEQIQNLSLRKIPYDSPGLERGEVDMVLIVNTYHHIENRPDYFARVREGIREDGKLVIIDYYDADIPVGPRHHKVSMDTVISELKEAGFTHFVIEANLLPYQYIITSKL